MSTSSQTEPPAIDPFWVVADERDFFFRAMEAERRAELRRQGEAAWLADRYISDDATSEDIDIAAKFYRQAAAAAQYATAVYEVEAAPVRARRMAVAS